jgi:4'-phosphopantetheinyl transferase
MSVALRTRIALWPCAELPAAISDSDVVVCTASLRTDAHDLAAALAVLDHPERERYAGFTSEAAAARFAIGRGIVRELLATLVGSKPADVPIRLDALGKPYLDASPENGPLWFSVAHAGDLLIVAVSRVSHVGVDVELMRPVANWRRLAARVLDDAERAHLEQQVSAGAAPGHALLRLWCRVEAELKAEGSGLAGLDARRDGRRAGEIRVADLPPLLMPPDLDATIACHGAVALWHPTAADDSPQTSTRRAARPAGVSPVRD